jgi:Type II CAAX prenyl endopeptidase Rce1-like
LSTSREGAQTRPVAEPPSPRPSSTSWLFFFGAIILFTVAMMLLSFPVGVYTVFGTDLSSTYNAFTAVNGLEYYLVFATVDLPIMGNLGGVFVVFLLIYLAFFLFAARQGAGLLGALRAAAVDGYDALFSNPLAATLILLGASSLATIALDTVQTSSGVPTGSLTGDPFSLLVNFTIAPLFEETTFRLMMLGLPVLILSLVLLRDFSPARAARVLWRPSAAWDVDETDGVETRRSFTDSDPAIFPGYSSDSLKARAMRPVVFVFLVASSLIFGYAHFASGAGWGPGKVSEAALSGLALGYLYIKYGFHASVLLHWSINYVGSVYAFLGQGALGVPWTSNTGSLLDVVPTVDFVLLLGLPSVLIVANELLNSALASRRSSGSRAAHA